MKKSIGTLLFVVFATAIQAQTFEKSISISPYIDFTNNMAITEGDNILIATTPFSLAANFFDAVKNSYLTKLDAQGNVLLSKEITPQSFNASFDSSIFILNLSSSCFFKNYWYVSGVVGPMDTNQNRINVFMKLDTNLNLINYQLDTNFYYPNRFYHLPGLFSTKIMNDTTMAVAGGQQSFETSTKYIIDPIYIEYDIRTMEVKKRRNYKNINLPYQPELIKNMLFKNEKRYLFATGFSLDPTVGATFIQAYKLNEKDSMEVFSLIEPPLRLYEPQQARWEAQAIEWHTDTSFVYVTSEYTTTISPNGYQRSGDVKIVLYDTAFNQLNSNVIQISDTVNIVSDYGNVLKYDSLTRSYYYGFTCNIDDVNLDFSRLFYGDTAFYRLIRFDRDLNIIWDRSYRRDGRMEMHSIEVDHKGNIIMAGIFRPNSNLDLFDFDVFILKVDSNGNLNTVGLNESKIIDQLNYSIYPNPATDYFTIKQYNVLDNYDLKMITMSGQVVKSNQLKKQTEQQINIEDLPMGVYLYQLTDSDGRVGVGKIVKQ